MTKKMKNQNIAGFSLIETIIAMALLAVGFAMFMESNSQLNTLNVKMKDRASQNRTLSVLQEQISSEIGQFQVKYGPLDFTPYADGPCTNKDKLPLSWDAGNGRYGFWITPFGTMRGLYQVTVRVYDERVFGKDKCVDFQFITGDR